MKTSWMKFGYSTRLARRRVIYLYRVLLLFFHLATLDQVHLPGQLLARYQQLLTPGFRWEDYVCDPVHDESAVLQAKYEICALALAGFLIVNSGQFRVRLFADVTSSVLPYLPTLEALDPKVDLSRFCELVPTGEPTVIPHYSPYNAMRLADLLSQYAEGADISSEQVAQCPDPFLEMVVSDSPSQVF